MRTFSLEQYDALRHGAGLLDRSARGRIAVTGADRLPYLQAMLTNDVAALGPGAGCYSAYLTPQGRMIADMRVFELGDLALVDVEPAVTAGVLALLEQFVFSEDVQFADLSPTLADVAVFGPRSPDVVAASLALSGAVAALPEYATTRAALGDASVVVAANWDLGVPGFDLFVGRDHQASLVARLLEAGATMVGDDAFEVVRVEAGRPKFGVDMTGETIPLEAGIEQRAISFTKGCYPGQEIITRVLHRGHGRVAKRLVGLVVEGTVVPQAQDAIEVDGKVAGSVTSATDSLLVGSPIALGYLQRDWTEPGTAVAIVHDGRPIPARVVPLPFVERRP